MMVRFSGIWFLSPNHEVKKEKKQEKQQQQQQKHVKVGKKLDPHDKTFWVLSIAYIRIQ